MTQPQTTDTPHFVVLTPGSDQGRRIDLTKDDVVVGRAATCDVRLDDPHVSRTHAALQRRGGAVYVQDLGSSAGTFVNEGTVNTSSPSPPSACGMEAASPWATRLAPWLARLTHQPALTSENSTGGRLATSRTTSTSPTCST